MSSVSKTPRTRKIVRVREVLLEMHWNFFMNLYTNFEKSSNQNISTDHYYPMDDIEGIQIWGDNG